MGATLEAGIALIWRRWWGLVSQLCEKGDQKVKVDDEVEGVYVGGEGVSGEAIGANSGYCKPWPVTIVRRVGEGRYVVAILSDASEVGYWAEVVRCVERLRRKDRATWPEVEIAELLDAIDLGR